MMNYPLRDVLRPHQTYVGVLVDAREVKVRSGVKGLVPGLTIGLTNALFGSRIGETSVTAHQYVVRLDAPHGEDAQLLTVVQGGPELIRPGTPVFLAASISDDGFVFSVRVIPAGSPEAYGVEGLEETRLQHFKGVPRRY